jgi:flagellin FlaB
MQQKKGEMAMGTLIIFIAMVLIAAVAAAVLISTTGTLQNKALSTGKATATEVGTSLNVIQVFAENGQDQSIEDFTSVLKLNAGSDPIRFEDLLVKLSLDDASQDFTYNNASTCDTVSNGDFAVEYSINGTNHRDGYLTSGDVAKLCLGSPRSVEESERITINFVPKVGTAYTIDTVTPDLMIEQRVQVFP